jgi:hypothetical protein
MLKAIEPPPGHYDFLFVMGGPTAAVGRQLEFIAAHTGTVGFDQIIIWSDGSLLDTPDGESFLQSLISLHFGTRSHYMVITAPSGWRQAVRIWSEEQPHPGKILLVSSNPFITSDFNDLRYELELIGWFADGGDLTPCGDGTEWMLTFDNRVALLLDCIAHQFHAELSRGE